jgi:YD repeat-containing protein
MGRVTAVTDALNKTNNFTLDALGRVVLTSDPTGAMIQSMYNAADEEVQTVTGTFAQPDLVTRSFDAVGNEIAETHGAPNTQVQMGYDGDGRMTRYTDALGNVTWFGFDADGRKVVETDPTPAGIAAQSQTWSYDGASRLTGHTDQLGRSETYSYYASDELQTEVWKNAVGTVVNTLNYTYNADDQLLTAGDNSGTDAAA